MFDISFNPIVPNGFTTYVMDSAQRTDAVIQTFDQAFAAGLSSQEALNYALQANGVKQENLTFPDIERINRKVEAVSGGNFNAERRF